MNQTFKFVSASFLTAIIIAGLGLVTNLVPSEKVPTFIAAVVTFVFASGVVAYLLNLSSANVAERLLNKIHDDCNDTLRHVRSEYTSSILRGAIIHDSELDILERSAATQEVWVVTPLNLDHDVPGRAFFKSLKENIDNRNVPYTYVIQDSEKARYNARQIAEEITRKDLMKFALLKDEEWHSLPIVGIPVTIHNHKSASKLRIYISTQQSQERGQHWAVFSGWTTAQIIEKTRTIVSRASRIVTLSEYAEN